MSSSYSSQIFTPRIANKIKSKGKQEFQSVEDAFAIYNAYVQQCRFSIRMSNSKKKYETNELIWKQFVYSKKGQTDTLLKKS